MTPLLITLAFLFIVIPIGGLITMLIAEKGNKDTYVEGLIGNEPPMFTPEQMEGLAKYVDKAQKEIGDDVSPPMSISKDDYDTLKSAAISNGFEKDL